MAVKIEGTCDPKFNRVKDAFAANFESGVEVGAAVALTLDGKPVVDLWAGHADKEKTRPWTRDTIVNVYSTTKGLTAICAHRLVDQGKLDIDAPVAKYWPEFAAAGKEKIPVRFLLSHRAGLAGGKQTACAGRVVRLGHDVLGAGRAEAVVGSRNAPRLPCSDVWISGRRSDSPDHGKISGNFFPRRAREAARPRYSYWAGR